MSEQDQPSGPISPDETESETQATKEARQETKMEMPVVEATPKSKDQHPVTPMIYPAQDVEANAEAEAQIRRMSRRSFLWGATALGATYAGWRWLVSRPDVDGIPWPFRRALEINENLAKDYFGAQRLVPTFARTLAREPRPNGFEGMPDVNPDVENADEFDPQTWRLSVMGLAMPPENSGSDSDASGETNQTEDQTPSTENSKATAPQHTDKKSKATAPSASSPKHKQTPETDTQQSANDNGGGSEESSEANDAESASGSEGSSNGQTRMLTLDDIKKLSKVTQTVEFKCIEGWSEIVNWTGARFADFAAQYGPATKSGDPPDVKNKPHDLMDYVSIETPDGGYYVGLDIASALHPQTLLCYEMNGEPLTLEHGGPLRLVIPVKYGVKNIKRIGTIRFTNQRPKDYWAEQGYDWYAGH